MRLQKQLSKKVKDKEYVKWVIVIPSETIEKLGWKEGEILQGEVKKNALTLKPTPPT